METYMEMGNEKSYRLYDWQKIIISFVRFVTNVLHKNIVVDIPTGHGKNIIIDALALTIAKDPKKILLLVSMKPFLSQCEFRLFEDIRGAENFPCNIYPNKVIYINCSELMAFPEQNLKD